MLTRGQPEYSAGSPRCKILITMVRTSPDAPPHKQQSMILVPVDTPGVDIRRSLPVFGWQDQHGHCEIVFDNEVLKKAPPYKRARMGIGYVPQGREIFAKLTIEENLMTGAYTRSISRSELKQSLEKVYHYFPRLKTRRTSQAGYTSGGEQQMCAIGRALMANPSMVLLDEPSMGLAPQIVEEVFEIVKDLNAKEKVTFLLAEQNTNMALKYADYGYIMESGRVVMDGAAEDLRTNEDVKEFYLGVGGGERKSFKDVKSYKRRKRWLA